MSGRSTSNVIPIRPTSWGGITGERRFDTTVLHAVADHDGLVEVAPVVAALERRPGFHQLVLHAGPEPTLVQAAKVGGKHRRLDIPAGTHAERTAAALLAFETVLAEERPDLLVVAGDDDVSVAAALAAAQHGTAVARLGGGMRCLDWLQPDEVNRTIIDRVADVLFTSSEDAAANLRREGIPEGRIHAVGSTRIDMLRRYEGRARALGAWRAQGCADHRYTLIVVRGAATLDRVAAAVGAMGEHGPVIAIRMQDPAHEMDADAAGEQLAAAGAQIVEPGGYVESLSLQAGAGAIVTDVGTIAEQASALGVRCYTPQQATARVITLTHGTNVLLGDDPDALCEVRPTGWEPTPAAIPLWDGHAGERVANALVANYTLAAAYAGDR
jgi:UDP-N-acetylglucosamine 2-epimerase (non-hydrolysing)